MTILLRRYEGAVRLQSDLSADHNAAPGWATAGSRAEMPNPHRQHRPHAPVTHDLTRDPYDAALLAQLTTGPAVRPFPRTRRKCSPDVRRGRRHGERSHRTADEARRSARPASRTPTSSTGERAIRFEVSSRRPSRLPCWRQGLVEVDHRWLGLSCRRCGLVCQTCFESSEIQASLLQGELQLTVSGAPSLTWTAMATTHRPKAEVVGHGQRSHENSARHEELSHDRSGVPGATPWLSRVRASS